MNKDNNLLYLILIILLFLFGMLIHNNHANLRLGMAESISYLTRVGDGNVGYVGSETGMLYIY